MNDNLDSLLKLLKEASLSQNFDQINTIQENLQKITNLIKVDIKKKIKQNSKFFQNLIPILKIEKLNKVVLL